MARTLTVTPTGRYTLNVTGHNHDSRYYAASGETDEFLRGDNTFAIPTKEAITGLKVTDTVGFAGVSVVEYTGMPDREADIVDAGMGVAITTGAGNTGGNAAMTSREFLQTGQKTRIMQPGTVAKVQFYCASASLLTGFYITVWRKDGTTYDRVGVSENLAASLVDDTTLTLTLSSPITGVLMGDYIGFRMEWAAGTAVRNLRGVTATGYAYYYVQDTTPATTDYDWEAATAVAAYVPIHVLMQAPHVVCIGDSIAAGHPHNYTFMETTATNDWDGTSVYEFCNSRGWVYQNRGIGGQNTEEILTRFEDDCSDLLPKVAIIHMGVNDFALSKLQTPAEALANWTAVLDLCVANDILAVCVAIGPWTNGTNTQMRDADARNAALQALIEDDYSTSAVYVNLASTLGQFRTGGDAGNLWDIKTAYAADGVHFNAAGLALAGNLFYTTLVASGLLDPVAYSELSATETLLYAPAAEPADGTLNAGQIAPWVDETGNTLSFKTMYADGVTINTGAVPLAARYDDIRVTPGSFDRPGSSDPAIVACAVGGGANTYLWEFAKNNIASFVVQLPHGYQQGEDIKVHVHWTPGTRGNEENGATVGWKLDYSWANINGTFGALATADLSDACDGTDHKHQMTPEVTITGAGKNISSMLLCNIKRTDTGTDDTWAGTVSGQLPMLLEIDFHVPIDTLGSRDWGTK